MKVCVVGGSGNISVSIVECLLELGHEVVCFNRGQSRAIPDGARLIQGDRKNREDFELRMQAERFDAAIDMICFNAEEAESSLRAFRGVSHFIQCSTVCTYGTQFEWMPVSEDHPLRPVSDYGRNKVKADHVFLRAWHGEGFPVTIVKPSTTYGPIMGCVRQVAWDFSWIDRIRKGKPILVCGDGKAIHQFLHVKDAGRAFALLLGKQDLCGETYNLVRQGFLSWEDYHRAAMRVLGREVELIGLPLNDLVAMNVPEVGICQEIFAHNSYYDSRKLFRALPEFQPRITIEAGLQDVFEALDREGRIPDSDTLEWEDRLIRARARFFSEA